MMKGWRPIIIENSLVPKFLSYFAPIDISGIALGFIVFIRGSADDRLRRHETIHFQQYLETLFIGFLIIYLYDYIYNLILFRDGGVAYRLIRAEVEAYDNDIDEDYLENRVRYAWLRR
jgi:hypothetical protein